MTLKEQEEIYTENLDSYLLQGTNLICLPAITSLPFQSVKGVVFLLSKHSCPPVNPNPI